MRKWIGMLLLLVVAGCGAPGGPAPVGPAPAAPGPVGGATAAHPYPLTIKRTGGFIGVNESITVRSDGSWSYAGDQGKAPAQGRLTAAELEQVTQTLANPAFAADVRPHS